MRLIGSKSVYTRRKRFNKFPNLRCDEREKPAQAGMFTVGLIPTGTYGPLPSQVPDARPPAFSAGYSRPAAAEPREDAAFEDARQRAQGWLEPADEVRWRDVSGMRARLCGTPVHPWLTARSAELRHDQTAGARTHLHAVGLRSSPARTALAHHRECILGCSRRALALAVTS